MALGFGVGAGVGVGSGVGVTTGFGTTGVVTLLVERTGVPSGVRPVVVAVLATSVPATSPAVTVYGEAVTVIEAPGTSS